jgi:Kef-type K+ transport system membrane component KefB
MNFIGNITFPVENPILIFAILLLVILLSPIVLRRFKVPHIIGMIVAGIILGPGGFGVLARDSSIELYGTVGMLYIMFLSGVEADIRDFKQNRKVGVVFGLLTAFLPLTLGVASSILVLDMNFKTSLLLASIYASHTLIAYPIVSKYGIVKTRAVSVVIMGTVITNIVSLLIFAVIESSLLGNTSVWHWIQFGLQVMAFSTIVVFGFPLLARKFFKKYIDNITQYIFVMALMLLAAFISQLAGIEGIIGAFLAGIALNRHIPTTSGLMNRIDFVGNAIFIPFFLIGIGMLIDLSVFVRNWDILKVAVLMVVVATAGKYLAAMLTRRAFSLKKYEGNMLFGLSNAQAAATLAVVTVCNREGWLGNDVLYSSIVMVLVTCLVSSLVTERASREIVSQKDKSRTYKTGGRLLIALNNPHTIEGLILLAKMLRNPHSRAPLFALHVVDKQNPDPQAKQNGKDLLGRAAAICASGETVINEIAREDDTIATGIINTCAEQSITDIVMGIGGENIMSALFAIDAASVLRRTHQSVIMARIRQPLGTLKRIVVAVPPQAEYEAGFSRWLYRLANLHRQTRARVVFYASEASLEKINLLNAHSAGTIKYQSNRFSDWQNFLILASYLHPDDLFVCVQARRQSLSYLPEMEQIPSLLSNYFRSNNILIIYPEQYQSNETALPFV